MKIRVKIDQKMYTVEVGDLNLRPITACVDGETYEVWPEDPATTHPVVHLPASGILRSPLPVTQASVPPGQFSGVIAPIPGTIVSVAVQAGDTVTPGQELLVLEAMKMKNLIRAQSAVTIARVAVKPGDRVSQGQPLVEFSA